MKRFCGFCAFALLSPLAGCNTLPPFEAQYYRWLAEQPTPPLEEPEAQPKRLPFSDSYFGPTRFVGPHGQLLGGYNYLVP